MLRKKFPFLVLLILLFLPPAAGQETPGAWGRYMFLGDEFSVELPGEPFVYRTERNVGGSFRDRETMRVFGLYSAGAVYLVASFDNPRRSESFDDFVEYIHEPPGFGPLAKKDATLGGFKGREYRKGGRLMYRVFRTPLRAYLVWATGEEAGAARFLNSLRLSPSPEGADLSLTPKGAELTGAQAAAPAASSRPPEDGPLKTADTPRKAVIVYKPAPGYTEEARTNGVSGVVRIRAVLSSSGRVTNITVQQALPDGLTLKAIQAARHILFFPAQKGDRPVSQYVTLEYNFNLH